MLYTYLVSTRSGETQSGSIEAATKDLAVEELREKNLIVLSIHAKRGKEAKRMLHSPFRFARISTLDKILFARHMSVMLKSGLSLTEALEAVHDQATSAKLKWIVKAIIDSVANGQSLSDSMARHEKVFSGVMINMIRIGEESGNLEKNLEHLAVQLEKDYDLKKKVVSAMIYPIIILVATILLGIVLTVFILPKLVDLFSTFRMELPFLTRVFLNIAEFLVANGWIVLIVFVVLLVGLRVLVKSNFARPFIHKLLLDLPITNKLTKYLNLARFARALALLLQSGLTINEGIAITANTLGNAVYKKKLAQAADEIKKGKTFASVLSEEKYFPKMISRMVDVGERTGKLQDSLFYIADFYEEEVDNTTKNLSTIIEPILLIVIGIVLGLLAAAIISPIYQFTGSLRG